jgi:hypothetical protein
VAPTRAAQRIHAESMVTANGNVVEMMLRTAKTGAIA